MCYVVDWDSHLLVFDFKLVLLIMTLQILQRATLQDENLKFALKNNRIY